MNNQILPSFFKPLFWSYDFFLVDPKTNQRIILVNAVNYGDLKHWQWLLEFYGKPVLAGWIKTVPASEFRPAALKLFTLLLGINEQPAYASRSDYIASQKSVA
ncbi:MAG: hypothetical protein Q8N81_07860 [bacterium]|nr:hypothetical protein [bacterium]